MMRFVIAIIVSLLVCLMIKDGEGYIGSTIPTAHATASRHVEVEESWPQLPQRRARNPRMVPPLPLPRKKGVVQKLRKNCKIIIRKRTRYNMFAFRS